MTREEARTAWKAARENLNLIEKERRALLAPTQARYDAADEALTEIEEECGHFIGQCEVCGEPIFDGDRYHVGDDVYLCEACAPSYEDMALYPDRFVDPETDEPMTKAKAVEITSAHIVSGGKITDKMVSS